MPKYTSEQITSRILAIASAYSFDVEEQDFFEERWQASRESELSPIRAETSDNNRPYWSGSHKMQPRYFSELHIKRKFVQYATQTLYFQTKTVFGIKITLKSYTYQLLTL